MSSLFIQRIGQAAIRMGAAVVFTGIGSIAEDYAREFKKNRVTEFKDDSRQVMNLVSNKKSGKEPDDYDLI